MRDQPQVWQYRPTDTNGPASDTVPTPREPADDVDPAAAPTGESDIDERDVDGRELDERDLDEPEAEADRRDRDPHDVDAGDRDPRDLDADDADLRDPDLRDPDLRDSDLRDPDLRDRDMRDADGEVAEEDADEAAVGVARVPGAVDERTEDRPGGDLPTDESAANGAADATVAADGTRVADQTSAVDDTSGTGTEAVDGTTAIDETTATDETGDADRAGADGRPDGEMMPGDVPESPMGALFDSAAADDFRDRWQRLQMRFVDDPRGAAGEARGLTDDVVSALHSALGDRIGSLASWQSGSAGDTEELRIAVRRYRDLLDRLLGL